LLKIQTIHRDQHQSILRKEQALLKDKNLLSNM